MMIKRLYDLLQILLKQNTRAHVKKQKSKLLIYDVYLKKYVNSDELLVPSPAKASTDSIQSWRKSKDLMLFDFLLKKFINPRLDLLSPAEFSKNNLSKILDHDNKREYHYASTVKDFWERGTRNKLQHVPALPSICDVGGTSVGWAGQVTGKPETDPRPEQRRGSSLDKSSAKNKKAKSATDKAQRKEHDKNPARNSILLYEGKPETNKKDASAKQLEAVKDVVLQKMSKSNVRTTKSHIKHNIFNKTSNDMTKAKLKHNNNDTNKKGKIVKAKSPKREKGTLFKKICSQLFSLGKFVGGGNEEIFSKTPILQGKDKPSNDKSAQTEKKVSLNEKSITEEKTFKHEKTIVKNNTSDINLIKNAKEHHKDTNVGNSKNTEITNQNSGSVNRGRSKTVTKIYEKTNMKEEPNLERNKNENIKSLNNFVMFKDEVKQNTHLTKVKSKTETNIENKSIDSTNGAWSITNSKSKTSMKDEGNPKIINESWIKTNLKPSSDNHFKNIKNTVYITNKSNTNLKSERTFTKTEGKEIISNESKNIENKTGSSLNNERFDAIETGGKDVNNNGSKSTRNQQVHTSVEEEASMKTNSKPQHLINLTTNQTHSNIKNEHIESKKADVNTITNNESKTIKIGHANKTEKNESTLKPSNLCSTQKKITSQDKVQPGKMNSLENVDCNFICPAHKSEPKKSTCTIDNNIIPGRRCEDNIRNVIPVTPPTKSTGNKTPQKFIFSSDLKAGEKENSLAASTKLPKIGGSFTDINIYGKADSLDNHGKKLDKANSASNMGESDQNGLRSNDLNIAMKTQTKTSLISKKNQNSICSNLKKTADDSKSSSDPQRKALTQSDGKGNTIKIHNIEPKATEKLHSISAQGKYLDDLALDGELNKYNIKNYRGFKILNSKSEAHVAKKNFPEEAILQNFMKRCNIQPRNTDKSLEKHKKLHKSTELKHSASTETVKQITDKSLINNKSETNNNTRNVKNTEKHSEVKGVKDQKIEKKNHPPNKCKTAQSFELKNDFKKYSASNKNIVVESTHNKKNTTNQIKIEISTVKENKKDEKTEEPSTHLPSANTKRNDFAAENKLDHGRMSVNKKKVIKPITFKYWEKRLRKNKPIRKLRDIKNINHKKKTETINAKLHKEIKEKSASKTKGLTRTSHSVNKKKFNKQPHGSKSTPNLPKKTTISTEKQENKKHNIRAKSAKTLRSGDNVQSGKLKTRLTRDAKITSLKNTDMSQVSPTRRSIQNPKIKKSLSESKYSSNPKPEISNTDRNRGSKTMVKTSLKIQKTVSKDKIIKESLPSANSPENKIPSKSKSSIPITDQLSRDVTKQRKKDRVGKTKSDQAEIFSKKRAVRRYASAAPKIMYSIKEANQVNSNMKSSPINKNTVSLKSPIFMRKNMKQTNIILPEQKERNEILKKYDQKSSCNLGKRTSTSKTSQKVFSNKSSLEFSIQTENKNIGKKQSDSNFYLKKSLAKKLSTPTEIQGSTGNSCHERQSVSKENSVRTLKKTRSKSENRPQRTNNRQPFTHSNEIVLDNNLSKQDIYLNSRENLSGRSTKGNLKPENQTNDGENNIFKNKINSKGTIKATKSNVLFLKSQKEGIKTKLSSQSVKLVKRNQSVKINENHSSKQNLVKHDEKHEYKIKYKPPQRNVIGNINNDNQRSEPSKRVSVNMNYNQLCSTTSKTENISHISKKEELLSDFKNSGTVNKNKPTIFEMKHSKGMKITYETLQKDIKTQENVKNDTSKKNISPYKITSLTSFSSNSKKKFKKPEIVTVLGSKVSGIKEQLNKKKNNSKIENRKQHIINTPKAALREQSTEISTPKLFVNSKRQTVNTNKEYKETHSGINSMKQTTNTSAVDSKESRSGRNILKVLNSTTLNTKTFKDHKEPHSRRNASMPDQRLSSARQTKTTTENAVNDRITTPLNLHESSKKLAAKVNNDNYSGNENKNDRSLMSIISMGPGKVNIKNNHSEKKDSKTSVATSERKQNLSHTLSEKYNLDKNSATSKHKLIIKSSRSINSSVSKEKSNINSSLHRKKGNDEDTQNKKSILKRDSKRPATTPGNKTHAKLFPAEVKTDQFKGISRAESDSNKTLHHLVSEQLKDIKEIFKTTAKNFDKDVNDKNELLRLKKENKVIKIEKPSVKEKEQLVALPKIEKYISIGDMHKRCSVQVINKGKNLKRSNTISRSPSNRSQEEIKHNAKVSNPNDTTLKTESRSKNTSILKSKKGENDEIDTSLLIKDKRFDVSEEIKRKLSSLSQKGSLEKTYYSPVIHDLIVTKTLDENKEKSPQYVNNNTKGNNIDKFQNDLIPISDSKTNVKKLDTIPSQIQNYSNESTRPNLFPKFPKEKFALTLENTKIISADQTTGKNNQPNKKLCQTDKEGKIILNKI